MSRTQSHTFSAVHARAQNASAQLVRARFRTYRLPAVKDSLVLGRSAPVAPATALETLKLGGTESYVLLPIADETVAAILIREAVLLKIDPESVIEFVVERIKPAMAATEMLSLDWEIELLVEESF